MKVAMIAWLQQDYTVLHVFIMISKIGSNIHTFIILSAGLCWVKTLASWVTGWRLLRLTLRIVFLQYTLAELRVKYQAI